MATNPLTLSPYVGGGEERVPLWCPLGLHEREELWRIARDAVVRRVALGVLRLDIRTRFHEQLGDLERACVARANQRRPTVDATRVDARPRVEETSCPRCTGVGRAR